MRNSVLILALLWSAVCVGCSSPNAKIEQAAKDYIVSVNAYTKVDGLTLQRKSDDLYLVGADTRNDRGQSSNMQILCRRFNADNDAYWKCEAWTPFKEKSYK